jgi:hypothetical protein
LAIQATHDLTDYQRSLIGSKILVLTGAGASVPFGMPTMAEFRVHLSSGMIDQISEMKKGFDLEVLLGVLTFYEQIGDRFPGDPLLQSAFHQAGYPLGSNARALKNDIFDKIIDLYGELSPQLREKAGQIYLPLFNDLLCYCGNQPSVLPIFTTNYDLTFEEIRILDKNFTLNNGLQNAGHNDEWASENYRGARDYKFAIFRLHGCSHWMRNKNNSRIVFQPAPDRKDLARKEPAVLYPLVGKEVAVSEEPFATGYSYLRECLRAARVILIIGYSGRDPLIQQYIAESLRHDTQKKIIVISKHNKLRNEFKVLERFSGHPVEHIAGGIEEYKPEEIFIPIEKLGLKRNAA